MEELGYVNPLTKKNSINKERALYWLGVGAQASPRVHNLLVSEKIVKDAKIKTFSVTKKAKEEAIKAAAAAAAPAAPAVEAPVSPAEAPKSESVVPEVEKTA